MNVRAVYLELSNVYELLRESCPKIQEASIRSSLQAEAGSVAIWIFFFVFLWSWEEFSASHNQPKEVKGAAGCSAAHLCCQQTAALIKRNAERLKLSK